MTKVKPPRSYKSGLRAEQARQTRMRVLDAAQTLFAQRGYAGTTMEAIAAEAGVAVDTVYARFGRKRRLLAALMDVRVGGDDQAIAVIDRPEPQAVRREPSQNRQIAMFAESIAPIVDRARPVDDIIRGAAAVDPEIAAMRTSLQETRYGNMRQFVGWVATNGHLREGLSLDDAAAIVWTVTSPEVNRLLRAERGWSHERYRVWLAETLNHGLLP